MTLDQSLTSFILKERVEEFIRKYSNYNNILSVSILSNVDFSIGAELNNLNELNDFNCELADRSHKYHSQVNHDLKGSIYAGLKRENRNITPYIHLKFKTEYMPFESTIPLLNCMYQGVTLTLNEDDKRHFYCHDNSSKDALCYHFLSNLNEFNFFEYVETELPQFSKFIVMGSSKTLLDNNSIARLEVDYIEKKFGTILSASGIYRTAKISAYFQNLAKQLIDQY